LAQALGILAFRYALGWVCFGAGVQSTEYGHDQNAEVMQGFLNILEKLVPDADDQTKAL
jgi:hypothetical protein